MTSSKESTRSCVMPGLAVCLSTHCFISSYASFFCFCFFFNFLWNQLTFCCAMDDGWHVWFAESDSYCSIYLFVIFIDALCFTSSSDDSSVWFWDGLTPLFERCCPLARITTPSFSSPFCTYFVLNAHWFVFAHIHRINSLIIWTGWRLINGSTCTLFLRLFSSFF